jgi:hypothetical protein
MKLAASGVYNEKNPTVKVNGAITKLDLNKLGFYEKPMIVAGKRMVILATLIRMN